MDDLLAQLQSLQPEAQKLPPQSSPQAGSLDSLLESLDERPKPAPQPSASPRFDALVKPPVQPAAPTDNLLADIKALYQAQDQAAALEQQAKLEAERQRQESLRRQRLGKVVKQAETWLKNLDLYSGEAAWFEEFAAKYSSRVEAAIDYLNLET